MGKPVGPTGYISYDRAYIFPSITGSRDPLNRLLVPVTINRLAVTGYPVYYVCLRLTKRNFFSTLKR